MDPARTASPLHGSVALVVGGSSGIGRAVAVRLAHQGARVALVARRRDLLEEAAAEVARAGVGPDAVVLALAADVSDADEAAAAVDQVVARLGRLDIVVNAAGTAVLAPFATSARGSWQAMIDTNVTGVVNVAHAAVPHLQKALADSDRGVSDHVTISSVAGRQVGPVGGVYSATKHAVGAFSESLRQELSGSGVRVALVEPGFVDTPLTAPMTDRAFRFLDADDVADAVEYVVTRPAHAAVAEVLVRPSAQVG